MLAPSAIPTQEPCMDTALYVLAALMVLIGLAGIILPILPGVVLVFPGMFLAAWLGDFVAVGPWTVGLLAGLTLLSLLVDMPASAAGPQRVNDKDGRASVWER